MLDGILPLALQYLLYTQFFLLFAHPVEFERFTVEDSSTEMAQLSPSLFFMWKRDRLFW